MKFLSGAALLSICLGANPAEAAWAVAMGTDNMPVIASLFAPNADAQSAALSSCSVVGHSKCRIVGTGLVGCFALAKTDPAILPANWAVGTSIDPVEAVARAVEACPGLSDKPCQVAVSFCGS
jgi:hypothetical protein